MKKLLYGMENLIYEFVDVWARDLILLGLSFIAGVLFLEFVYVCF